MTHKATTVSYEALVVDDSLSSHKGGRNLVLVSELRRRPPPPRRPMKSALYSRRSESCIVLLCHILFSLQSCRTDV